MAEREKHNKLDFATRFKIGNWLREMLEPIEQEDGSIAYKYKQFNTETEATAFFSSQLGVPLTASTVARIRETLHGPLHRDRISEHEQAMRTRISKLETRVSALDEVYGNELGILSDRVIRIMQKLNMPLDKPKP